MSLLLSTYKKLHVHVHTTYYYMYMYNVALKCVIFLVFRCRWLVVRLLTCWLLRTVDTMYCIASSFLISTPTLVGLKGREGEGGRERGREGGRERGRGKEGEGGRERGREGGREGGNTYTVYIHCIYM